MSSKTKIAFWFRYGPAEHAQLFHAIPQIVYELSQVAEVHYFGMDSPTPLPALIRDHAIVHTLPFRINRRSTLDKFLKTGIWVAAIPFVARTCRAFGIHAVYIDETIPLTVPLARLFFGPNVAVTVADFFLNIYLGPIPVLRALGQWITRLDMAAWRQLPLIFTRAKYTAQFLAKNGFDVSKILPVYDPCDFEIYRPLPHRNRQQYGFTREDVVLVHHGILHPNKGNDRIIRWLADARTRMPAVKLLLVGDGPQAPILKKLVRTLRLEDRVIFTGWLPTLEEVNQALNAADIGLVMRIGQESDNFHVTGALVHSMACGLPVLAARLGGISEVVQEGDSGFLFDPNNQTEFLSKLEKLVSDPGLRAQMGRKALERARQLFDISIVTRQTIEGLLRLLPRGNQLP